MTVEIADKVGFRLNEARFPVLIKRLQIKARTTPMMKRSLYQRCDQGLIYSKPHLLDLLLLIIQPFFN